MPTALVALFLIFFVAMWLAVCRLSAWFGGWSQLAKAYPQTWETGDDLFHAMWGQGVQVGHVTYNNCVRIRAGATGLDLCPIFLFRAGHPGLHIPWDDLHVSPGQSLFWRTADLRAAKVPTVRIRISWSLAQKLAEATSGAFRLPDIPRSG